jgi:ABC-type glycerol-3-phosphate transport system substrate-binding protein
MPQGVSFELKKDGQPKRIGTRKAHTFGWFWGIPKNAPEPDLAYRLAKFMTNHESQFRESKEFGIFPTRPKVVEDLKRDQLPEWQMEIFTKSIEQLHLNEDNFVPKFSTLANYKEFCRYYYENFEEIVKKMKYSQAGPGGRVDRNFIRENIR